VYRRRRCRGCSILGRRVRGGRAAPKSVARIRSVADRVGYVANPHAAGLRTQRSNLIGVLVPRLSDLVLATIYEGIDDAAGGPATRRLSRTAMTMRQNSGAEPRCS